MAPILTPLEARELLRADDVVLVDIRSPAHFARGHPGGALNVAYSERGLAGRVALVLRGDPRVVLLAGDQAQAQDASRQLAAAGRACLGCALDDPQAWRAAGLVWRTLPERSIASLGQAPEVVVLDVREPIEWDTGHVPGAVLVPLGRLRDEIGRLPRDREVAVICESGVRSATGASILLGEGFAMVANVPEGTAGYRRLRGPLAYPARAGRGGA